jgi:hypothetical protein
MPKAWLSLLLALVGCGPEPRHTDWTLSFADPALAGRAAVIEVRILREGCAGTEAVYRSEIAIGGSATTPPTLEPGIYGLSARARDDACIWFAADCLRVRLPEQEGAVTLTLTDAPEMAACPASECMAGACGVGDSGLPDSSVPDVRPDVMGTCASDCPLGCSAADPTRCAALIPSNVDASLFDATAPDVDVDADTSYDTDDCDGLVGGTGATVTSTSGREVCVLPTGQLTVSAGSTLTLRGARPLVILASGDVVIEGVVDASGDGTTPGPGGAPPRMGPGAGGDGVTGADGTDDFSAGGGGGFCGAGGVGGASLPSPGGTAGATMMVGLEPLLGGSGGGQGGGRPDTLQGVGGAGGGALQISARGSIRGAGFIRAGGGGGGGGRPGADRYEAGAGGGGGSGGGVLLEAADVQLSAIRSINVGGGGGGGGNNSLTGAMDGENGGSAERAAGSPSGGLLFAGDGGDGAGGSSMDGGDGEDTEAHGGGGGGGAGCVVLKTPAVATPTVDVNPAGALMTGFVRID